VLNSPNAAFLLNYPHANYPRRRAAVLPLPNGFRENGTVGPVRMGSGSAPYAGFRRSAVQAASATFVDFRLI